MPDLPKKKVGIVACSGEELAGGTVTICLPLFLAGGEGDRAFARFYPTVAVDGCAERCAARATERYSGKPAVSVVVTALVAERGLGEPHGPRRLDAAGLAAVAATADLVAQHVDALLGQTWDRRAGTFATEAAKPAEARCACGSGIPVREVSIGAQTVTLIALPVLLRQFCGDTETAA